MAQTDFTHPSTSSARRPKKRLIALLLVLVLLVVAAGTAFYAWRAVSDRSMLEEAVAEVTITKDGFAPTSLLIAKGQSVTWTNEDEKVHQLTADQQDLTGFDAVELAPGESINFTFDEAGTYTYHDTLHPDTYQGTVIVE